MLLQPLVLLLQPQRRSCRVLLLPGAGCDAAEASPSPTSPTAGQALRRWQPHTAAEPVNPRSPLRAGLPSSTAVVLSAWRGQRGQGTTSIGRGLYVERLTAGSTAAARKCLLIMCKIMIPPPDSWDPPEGSLYFVKKHSHRCHLGPTGNASLLCTKK